VNADVPAAAGTERHRRALLSTLTASGFGYLMMAISFVTVPFYLKWLGVGAYGEFLTLLAFMGYLNFADAGLNWGALVLIGHAHGRRDKQEVATLYRHAMILAFISAFLALLFAVGVYLLSIAGYRLPMFAAGPSPGFSLLLIGLKSALMLSMSSVMAMAYGLQEGYFFTRLQGYFQLIGSVMMLLAAFRWRNVEAVVAASALSSALACLITLVVATRRYADYLAIPVRYTISSFRLLLRTGAKGFLLQGSRLLRTTMPVFLLATFLGTGSVPALTLPTTLLGVVTVFLFNWSASLQTAYGDAWSKGDRAWISRSIEHLIVRGLGWMLLASCFILGLGQWFVRVWTGGHVSVPIPLLFSVVAIAVASWATDLFIFALVGINRQRRIAFVEMGNACLATLVGWLLCANGHAEYIGFAVLGSALATTLFFGWRQLCFWLGTRSLRPDVKSIGRLVLVAAFTFAVLIGGRSVAMEPSEGSWASWLKLTGVGAAGSVAFLAGIAVSGITWDQWPGFDWRALTRKWQRTASDSTPRVAT
jgi:O-antigen/teichoic acid export membrane protein